MVVKKIVKFFKDIEELENVDLEILINIDEIGEKIVWSIFNYFVNELNCKLVDWLKIVGL